jgi:hypothetical protein
MDVAGAAFAAAKQLCLPHPPNDCSEAFFSDAASRPSRFAISSSPPGAAMKTQLVRFYKA